MTVRVDLDKIENNISTALDIIEDIDSEIKSLPCDYEIIENSDIDKYLTKMKRLLNEAYNMI